MINQACTVRPKITNLNSNVPVFYLFSIKTSKCSVSCNNINHPYAKICIPEAVKNWNVKVFNPMSRTNEIRHIKWHETCTCECRLDVSVIITNVGMMINVDGNVKSWLIKTYVIKDMLGILVIVSVNVIGYENCKCRKRLIDKLVEECSEDVYESKLAGIALFKHGHELHSLC